MGPNTKVQWIRSIGNGKPYWVRAYYYLAVLTSLVWGMLGIGMLLMMFAEPAVSSGTELLKQNMQEASIAMFVLFLIAAVVGIWKKRFTTISQHLLHGPLYLISIAFMLLGLVILGPFMILIVPLNYTTRSFRKKEKYAILSLPVPVIVITLIIITIWAYYKIGELL